VVLVLSLLGSAVTCFIFGTSTTLQQAIVIRLAQGVFAGAVGVARGSVAFVTDATNEGRAYAILGYGSVLFLYMRSSHITSGSVGGLVVSQELSSAVHVRLTLLC
jgi:MFS family permease